MCAHNEHFLEYRQIVKDEIEAQLAEFQRQEAELELAKSKSQDAIAKRGTSAIAS